MKDAVTVVRIANDPRFPADALFAELVDLIGKDAALVWWNAAADLVSYREEELANA